MLEKNKLKYGYLFAIFAFSIWGLSPIYFKLLNFIPINEIMIYRIGLTAVLASIIIMVFKLPKTYNYIKNNPKDLLILCISSSLQIISWSTYVWAVYNNKILEISLAYFLSPLIMLLISIIILKEKLNKYQYISVMLAILAMLIQIFNIGSLPWVALVIPSCLGFYGLIRKKTSAHPVVGTSFETWLWVMPAILYWLYLSPNISYSLNFNQWQQIILLIGLAIITLLPLIFFTTALKILPYSAVAFLQYINPSLNFIVAIFIYNENISLINIITFVLIWIALLINIYNTL